MCNCDGLCILGADAAAATYGFCDQHGIGAGHSAQYDHARQALGSINSCFEMPRGLGFASVVLVWASSRERGSKSEQLSLPRIQAAEQSSNSSDRHTHASYIHVGHSRRTAEEHIGANPPHGPGALTYRDFRRYVHRVDELRAQRLPPEALRKWEIRRCCWLGSSFPTLNCWEACLPIYVFRQDVRATLECFGSKGAASFP